ncbi:hypothetical protein TRIP_B170070 [uncultured Desulfatiglans sp.]|nr:hypothetical protein TRIP_B170070 [uncultured Desulfatiglans sp.]
MICLGSSVRKKKRRSTTLRMKFCGKLPSPDWDMSFPLIGGTAHADYLGFAEGNAGMTAILLFSLENDH